MVAPNPGSGAQPRVALVGNAPPRQNVAMDLARGIVLTPDQPAALKADSNLSTSRRHRQGTGRDHLAQDGRSRRPPFEFDVQQRVPSTRKAKDLLGATPTRDEGWTVIPWISELVKIGTI